MSEREQEVLRQAAEAEDMTVSAFILSTVVPPRPGSSAPQSRHHDVGTGVRTVPR
ncbi:MAG: DUF1778 domain-containing protein [Pseudonocardiales bacterium]|nr:DUF1778 domain-containing protein [Pseudonocardiales bacterium]